MIDMETKNSGLSGTTSGTIVSLALSRRKGTRKSTVGEAVLKADHGFEGDAHAGAWHRQVCFLAAEQIDASKKKGLSVDFGAYAENIATTGIDWKRVPVGTRFRLGAGALVEITQIGKTCHKKCAIFYQAGDCIMPREGVFARVLTGGTVRVGDRVEPVASVKPYQDHETLVWPPAATGTETQHLIAEEPLSIRVQGNPYSVVMRTPGDERAHVAGFCLGEGLADRPGEITTIAFCDGADTNVVTVTLTPERQAAIADIADRREFVSQTSCGLCGKAIVDDLFQKVRPVTDDTRLDTRAALDCLNALSSHQPLRAQTRAVHAAAIYDRRLSLLSVAEDVGRHNALDKAVGKLFLAEQLDRAALLVLSSRISYELVQKAARARIPVIVAVSRPTSLAVALAGQLNMTLACRAGKGRLNIFCGGHRLL
jgi:FdhD protein